MGTAEMPQNASYSRAMQHLGHGSSDADKALGALTIALMCEEGNIPQDAIIAGELRDCLFEALGKDDAGQVKVGVSFLTSVSPLEDLIIHIQQPHVGAGQCISGNICLSERV